MCVCVLACVRACVCVFVCCCCVVVILCIIFDNNNRKAQHIEECASTILYCSLKDKSKVRGDFLTRFTLKFAENDDVGETVI